MQWGHPKVSDRLCMTVSMQLSWGCRSVQHRAPLAVTEQPPLTGSSGLTRWLLLPGRSVRPRAKPSLQLELTGGLFARLSRESRSQRAWGMSGMRSPRGWACWWQGWACWWQGVEVHSATARSRLLLQGRV